MVADVAYLQQNQQQIDALEPLLAAQRAAYRANPMPSAEQRRAWLKALRELILGEQQALIDAVSRDFSNRAAEETLLAVTWNAARALGLEAQVGHLNPGAWGDAVAWECEALEELPYWMPAVRPDTVFMRGADLALPAVERRVWP